MDGSQANNRPVKDVGGGRKRQQTIGGKPADSMSSSSSTSSSCDLRTSKLGQKPEENQKRTNVISRSDLIKRNLSGVSALADSKTEDFETNLIRDVYSEISKLRATFAVTSSNSAEDSMSSHSSNGVSAEADRLSSASSTAGATNEEDEDDEDQEFHRGSEPMYSNLSLPNGRDRLMTNSARRHSANFNQRPETEQFNNSYQQQQQPNAQAPFDYRPTMFSTHLNPIPECGELATPSQPSAKPPRVAPKPINYTTNKLLAANQSQTNGPRSGRLPTNHYLINDVQYAKISKANLRPTNFESFL